MANELILRPFQRAFLRDALAPDVRTAMLSLPRGNGKSSLVASLAARTLRPEDPLHVAGVENHIVAASIGQARRTVFKLLREQLGADEKTYKFAESHTSCHVFHRKTRARVSVLASGAAQAQGLVRCRWIWADEPGSWQATGGASMYDAMRFAMGKPGCALRAVLIGTIAPSLDGWWYDAVRKGSRRSTRVHVLQGDRKRWDDWQNIRKCNPLMASFRESRETLLEDRDDAQGDSRLRAAFLSYRLNVPSLDETSVLLSVSDWDLATARPVPDRDGRPVVGLDMGRNRSWSAAVAWWPNGRVEGLAVAPGLPGIEAQEKRDTVKSGTYRKLIDAGLLTMVEGLRVVPPGALIDRIRQWHPAVITCDRFRLDELRDTAPICPIVPRVTRYSESTADIRALRRAAKDGPMAPATESRPLIEASLSVARVAHDDGGSMRMIKDSSHNKSRDDVAFALMLAGGLASRMPKPRRHGAYLGVA